MTMCAPIARARCLGVVEAGPQLRLELVGGRRRPARAGGTLISMLNWPSSVWKSSLAIALSTSALRIAGSCAASTRLNSISSPVSGRSKSNFDSLSIRREHVQAAPQLLAGSRWRSCAGERPGLDLFAHAGRLPSFPTLRSGWHGTGWSAARSPCPPAASVPGWAT